MICSWYSICRICLICIQECICIWLLFGFMYVCTYALMPAPHTHTNIQNYSSTHMYDKYPLWHYLFTVTYLCIIRTDVLQVHMPGVYPMCCGSPFCCSWPQRSTETKRKERKLEEGIAPVWSRCFFVKHVLVGRFGAFFVDGWITQVFFLLEGMSVKGKQRFLDDDISPDSLFVDAWNQPCHLGDSSLLPSCRWCARVFRGTGYIAPWKFTWSPFASTQWQHYLPVDNTGSNAGLLDMLIVNLHPWRLRYPLKNDAWKTIRLPFGLW